MKIEKNKVVSLEYTLKFDDAEGEIIEVIDKSDPEVVLIGHEILFDKLEQKLIGLSEGDRFEVTLSPEESFGLYDEDNIFEIPKENFLVDGKFDEELIYEGAIIPMEDKDNDIRSEAIVLEIRDDNVLLDFNHPLAGETLHFEGSILSVRNATKEEIENEDVLD
jgi:FKBP-type peptidyl-prolyl cis-trans isomerase SlyD